MGVGKGTQRQTQMQGSGVLCGQRPDGPTQHRGGGGRGRNDQGY